MGKKNGFENMIEVMKWFAGNTLKNEAPKEIIERVIGIKIGTDKRTIKKYFNDLKYYGFITLKKQEKQTYALNHELWLKTATTQMEEAINGNLNKTIEKLRINPINKWNKK